MINLDTEQLKSLLAQLESANNQIDEAMACLQRVTTHSSWGCAERNTINEHILENRQQMQRVQQESESFLTATRAVADDFCTTENDISNWFASVDEAIARVNGIRVGSIASIAAAAKKAFENIKWKTTCPHMAPRIGVIGKIVSSRVSMSYMSQTKLSDMDL